MRLVSPSQTQSSFHHLCVRVQRCHDPIGGPCRDRPIPPGVAGPGSPGQSSFLRPAPFSTGHAKQDETNRDEPCQHQEIRRTPCPPAQSHRGDSSLLLAACRCRHVSMCAATSHALPATCKNSDEPSRPTNGSTTRNDSRETNDPWQQFLLEVSSQTEMPPCHECIAAHRLVTIRYVS